MEDFEITYVDFIFQKTCLVHLLKAIELNCNVTNDND